jgi:tyrosyl-tRNA synthetase
MIQGGGISINRNKIETAQDIVGAGHLLHDTYILVQKGKRNYYLVQVAD